MSKKKGVYIGRVTRAKLQGSVRKGRRETIYKMVLKRLGHVPCYVCAKHVKDNHATLEHKVKQEDGGTDDMSNLAISHGPCNHRRTEATVCAGANFYPDDTKEPDIE